MTTFDIVREYVSTLKIDGTDWLLNGTAVAFPYDVKPDHRQLTTGNIFRVVNSKPLKINLIGGGTYSYRRNIKQTTLRLTLEDVAHRWLQRLKNLQDSNTAFEIQLTAMDSQQSYGVPLRPLNTVNTNFDPPTLSNRDLTLPVTTPGVLKSNVVGSTLDTLLTIPVYSYKIVAIFSSTSQSKPSESIEVGMAYKDIDNNIQFYNNLTIYWLHVPGAIKYKIYGRTKERENLIWTSGDTSAFAPGTLCSFVDDGHTYTEFSTDSTSPYKYYGGSFECRWLDKPETIEIAVNGVVQNPTIIDHNGNIVVNGTGCNVYTKYGVVEFTDPILPTAQVRAKYIWEPKAKIDQIEPNPRPVGIESVYTSPSPSFTDSFDTTLENASSNVVYSPIVTMLLLEY
jgi:hypothetical protein